MDWAGPWLGFPGRSLCIRVRGTHQVLPPPSDQPWRITAVSHPKTHHGQQHLQPSVTVVPLSSCAGSGPQGRAWKSCGWPSPPPARHQFPAPGALNQLLSHCFLRQGGMKRHPSPGVRRSQHLRPQVPNTANVSQMLPASQEIKLSCSSPRSNPLLACNLSKARAKILGNLLDSPLPPTAHSQCVSKFCRYQL